MLSQSILIKSINMTRWISAEQATATLGVSRQTLYAYVSRRLIGVTAAADDPRRSLYDATDIKRLAERKRRGRSRNAIAAATLDFGEPVLASSITRIEGGRLAYRGKDAIALAATATLEDVAALLWQVATLPASDAPRRLWPRAQVKTNVAEACLAEAAHLAALGRWNERVEPLLADAVRILDRVAWAACGHRGTPLPTRLALHERLASAWGVGPKAADMMRRALVLLADHELNSSTYAARVVASTRAPLGACVLAGLAALSGPLHGGATEEARALLADPAVAADPAQAIAARLARGERIPGFGHRLYPDGDARAKALLDRIPSRPLWQGVIEAVQQMVGVAPNVDFANAVMERHLRLPTGAAFGMFAVGRTVGWIAHALEQWREGSLIRPRAVYRA
jgi:citrate synthase